MSVRDPHEPECTAPCFDVLSARYVHADDRVIDGLRRGGSVVHADGKERAASRFEVPVKELPPGGTASFRTSVPRPGSGPAEVHLQVYQGS